MKLNPKLKTFWKTKAQIRVLYGGRMSSKSFDVAGILIYLASNYKIRILCIRRYQNKIDESVYALLKEIIENDDYFKNQFTILKSSIIHNVTNSEFIFFGLHRSIDEVVGLQNINITWIEEAHSLLEFEWNRLRPTILRSSNSFCILVFNPQFDTDFVYKNFVINQRDDTLVRKINYLENPFLNESAKTLIENDKKYLEPDDFNHIYLGNPKSENEESFIKRAWLEACINANEVLGITTRGSYKIGYDIADSGNDKSANVVVHGNEVIEIIEWKSKEHELELSAEKTLNRALEYNANIIYDCIGVGASAGAVFKRLGYNNFSKFDAGAGVKSPDKDYMPRRKNKDHFENLKAQSWQKVADMMLHTYKAVVLKEPFNEDMILSINPKCDKIEQLKIELSSPMKQLSVRGLVKVESKKDLAKRGIPSPNIADAFIMAFAEFNSFGRFK